MNSRADFRGALFDLDGTLADNYTAIWKCLGAAFAEFGIEAPSYERVFKSVGGSILLTIRKLLPADSDEKLSSEIGEFYMKNFDRFVFDGLRAMPYSAEILCALHSRGTVLACFTNKQTEGAEAVLEHLGLRKYLDAVIGTSLHSPRKPSPEYTAFALKTLSLTAQETVGIGDSPYDYQAADCVGMPCALVATGADSEESLRLKCSGSIGVYKNLLDLADGVFGVAL